MNLKRVLFTGMAAMCALTSVFATANAQIVDGATVTVTLDESGNFNAYICEATYDLLTGAGVTSSTGGTAYGHIGLCFADTVSYRDGFTVTLQASDFEHDTLPGVEIPASAFTPEFIYNPHQGQWGWTNPNLSPGVCPYSHGGNQPGAFDVGDVGGLLGGGANPSGNSVTGHPGATWNGGSLASAQYVTYSWNGVGTGNGSLVPCDNTKPVPSPLGPNAGNQVDGSITSEVNGTYAGIDVQLAVPPGAPAGDYESDLTMTLTWGQP